MSSRPLALARWVAVLSTFALTAECFARLDDAITWGAAMTEPYSNTRLLRQDSLGFRGRPNFRYQKWRMNNLGFRGPDISPQPRPGVTRIAVMGASETFGLYEDEGGEYPARMQRLLDSLAPGRYEVINAGLPGLSLASMVPYFRRTVAPAGASMLVIYPSPPFYLEVNPLPLEYTPPRYRPEAPTQLGPLTLDPGFFESRLAGKSREVAKQLIPTAVVTRVREERLERRRGAHPADWVWQTQPPTDRMETLRIHLERLVAAIRDAGIKPVLITHANRFDGALQDSLGPDRRHLVNLMALYYPQATPRTLVATDSIANEIARRVAKTQGALVIEAEGRIPPNDTCFADYLHFTDAGAERMARLVVEGILAADSLGPPAPAP